jgi:hypothetical protein
MLQVDQEVTSEEREHVRQAAVRMGLINPLRLDSLTPVPKRSRREPRSHTASLALKDARSRSVSVSSMRKHGRSASLDTPRQSTFVAHSKPSPCPLAGEEDTPMNSPAESLTGTQIAQVKQELIEDDPLRGLRSSSHCPDNAMSDDAPSPKHLWPSTAHLRHATPAPDFATLPSHFAPTPEMPPFMACIGGNNIDDGPAPSDQTPSVEPDPTMAAAHHITNQVRMEIHTRLNPITRQLNTLTNLVQWLTDQIFAPTVAMAAPPKAAPMLARKPPQNPIPPTPPVLQVLPVPTVPVPTHIPVTDTTSEAPCDVPPSHTVDAAVFPSLEETCLAIPSRRIKRNVENKAVRVRQRQQVPGATGPLPTSLPTPAEARVDGDDGHIPLCTSRVRPMFASIVTQKAMATHQSATTTGNQACAIQNRSKSGKQMPIPPDEQPITYATVIRHGGLPDSEAEHALHARPTHFLVQAAQRALD